MKNHNISKIILSLVLITFVISCDDIFEKDIREETVYMYTPYDGLSLNSLNVNFWFEYVDGAQEYNLQVVSPNFEYPEKILLDTNLVENQFTFTLYPDTFECRIYAFNSGYATNEYTYAWFVINDTTDLAGAIDLNIISPAQNLITNNPEILFNWNAVEIPVTYEVIIKQDDWQGQVINETRNIENDSVLITLDEGNYLWGLRAVSENGSKTEYVIRSFMVDTTSPLPPELVSPKNNDSTVLFNASFSWNSDNLEGSNVFDSLFIADNVDFAGVEKFKGESNRVTLSELGAGSYFWKVKSYDVAGNTSPFSETRVYKVVDTTTMQMPGIPQLLSPADSSEITSFPLELSWIRGAENGNILFDSLYIANDTLFNQADKYRVNSERFTINNLNTGSYYWKVKTNDVEGNSGKFSITNLFIVK